MKVVRKTTDTGGNLSKEEIINFCNKEHDQIKALVPEEQYLDYAMFKNGRNYRVLCSYRAKQILNYTINPQVGVDLLNTIDISIHRYICQIICTAEDITAKEEDYLLTLLGKPELNCISIIFHFFKQLPEHTQQKLYETARIAMIR